MAHWSGRVWPTVVRMLVLAGSNGLLVGGEERAALEDGDPGQLPAAGQPVGQPAALSQRWPWPKGRS